MDSVLAGSSMDQFHVDVAIPRRVKCVQMEKLCDPSNSTGVGSTLEKRCDGHSTQSRVIPASLSKNKIIATMICYFPL